MAWSGAAGINRLLDSDPQHPLQTASGQLEVARLDNESSASSCCCEESRLSTCIYDGFRRKAVGNLYWYAWRAKLRTVAHSRRTSVVSDG